MPQRIAVVIALSLILLAGAAVRLRVADAPLERDEGEYAYAGQLILRGIPPYQQVYNMKFPGTYYAYAAILAAFGETRRGIHHGLLLWNALTTLVLFFFARRLLGNPWPAVATAAVFVALTLDRGVLGPFGHATHFILLPALAGLLVLLRGRLVLAGVLLGVSVLMKQHAIFFAIAAAAYLWWTDRSIKRLALFAAGGALPFVAMVALFAVQGVLDEFWFWTFRYASEYVSEIPLSRAWTIFRHMFAEITTHTLWMWIAAGAGLVALWVGRWNIETKVLLTGLTVASFLAVCPGFFFRNHYFIVMLPAVALLVGVLVATIERAAQKKLAPPAATAASLAACVVILLAYMDSDQKFLFSMTPRELSRAAYGDNPFVEAPEIARYIKERTTPQDRIAVLGSEPEIYFYADRKSATGYIYTYPLMEPQPHALDMQRAMQREIEETAPKYLVIVWVQGSWYVQPESNRSIFRWIEEYGKKCYDAVGLIDIHSPERSEVLWEARIAAYRPRSPRLVYVTRRKSECG